MKTSTLVATFICLGFSTMAMAGPITDSCLVGAQPAASLFLPYFEVDLGDLEGSTTLLSVGNRSEEPTLARVVVWTDWAIPVYAFDLLLPSHGLQTLNLREVVGRGTVPTTGTGLPPVGQCTSPITNPTLGELELAELHAQLTGRAAGPDDLCWSSDRGETSVAVGFVTVDVLQDCSDTVRYPTDEGYFLVDETGLGGYDNVLYGDWFLVDPSQDLAQGGELVHLVADPDFFTEESRRRSFYRSLAPQRYSDKRIPLSAQWQTRYLRGGGFGGETELILWIEPNGIPRPRACGTDLKDCVFNDFWFTPQSENGGLAAAVPYDLDRYAFTRRLRMLPPDPEVPEESGLLELNAGTFCCICSPPSAFGHIQAWAIPIFKAENRFSAGANGTRLNDLCFE